jgi:hypothetical protein
MASCLGDPWGLFQSVIFGMFVQPLRLVPQASITNLKAWTPETPLRAADLEPMRLVED